MSWFQGIFQGEQQNTRPANNGYGGAAGYGQQRQQPNAGYGQDYQQYQQQTYQGDPVEWAGAPMPPQIPPTVSKPRLQSVDHGGALPPKPVAEGAAAPKAKSSAEAAAAAKKKKAAAEAAAKRKQEALQHQQDAETAFRSKRYAEAGEAYSRAMQLDPQNPHNFAGRGGANLRLGNAQAAIPDLNEALNLDPQNMFALRDRAEARAQTSDFRGALADYDLKLSLAPADGRALCGRGDLKQKMGDTSGAINDYRLACTLRYPDAQAKLEKAMGGRK